MSREAEINHDLGQLVGSLRNIQDGIDLNIRKAREWRKSKKLPCRDAILYAGYVQREADCEKANEEKEAKALYYEGLNVGLTKLYSERVKTIQGLRAELENIKEVNNTLAEQGLTHEAVIIKERTIAEAEADSIAKIGEVAVQEKEADLMAKKKTTTLVLGLGLVILIGVGAVVYKRFIKK